MLAKPHLEHGVALYDPKQHRSHVHLYGGHDPGVCCRYYLAMTLWTLGYPDQALRSIRDAVTLAQELTQPLTTALALFFAAWLHVQRGEHRAAAEKAEAVVTSGTAQGIAVWPETASMLLAFLVVEEGRHDDGIAQLQEWVAAAKKRLWGWKDIFCLCLLAEASLKAGRHQTGLQMLSEAMGGRNIQSLYEPELHRLKGELLLAQGLNQDAEASFRRAIEIARARQSKSLELRGVMGLARLLARQGKRGEGRHILEETYGWFTEGFDTADLKQAKALLQELSTSA